MSEKYIPFPVDLTKYQSVEELTPLQFGILMRFIQRFWKTGIHLPKIEFQLYHIARCPFNQWVKSRERVYKAMEETLPDIINARNKEIAIRQKFGETIRKSNALKRMSKHKQTAFSDQESPHTNFTAIPPENKRYNEGQFDAVARTKALKNKDDDSDVVFKDR